MADISVILQLLSQLQDDESFKYIGLVAVKYSSGKLTDAVVPKECEAFGGIFAGKINVLNLLNTIWCEITHPKVDGICICRPETAKEYNKLCGAILV